MVTVLGSQEEAKALVRRLGGKLSAAWHGSPHDFDQFRMSAVGTGEGAQAYGYGLYFASAKAVAEHYKKKLSSGSPVLYKGKDISESFSGYGQNHVDALMEVASTIKNGKSPYGAISDARENWAYWTRVYKESYDNAETTEMRTSAKEYADMSSKMEGALASLNPRDFEQKPGRLYKVELAPQEDEYLLWDRPLSEQSEKVKAALEKARSAAKFAKNAVVERKTGSEWYSRLSSEFGDKRAASQYLHSLGIRGIKYLDGSSRSKGEGAYNYVIFDESDITITAKYSKNGAIQGLYADGKAYLVADGIEKGQANAVLLHELGEHANQLGFANDREYQSILRGLERRAEAQTATGEAIRKALARVPDDTRPEHKWSEVAAYLIENSANREIGIVKRLLNFFKKWLFKAGMIRADLFTTDDLVLFATAAVRSARA